MQHVSPDFLQNCRECPIRHRAVCARCDAAELTKLEEMKFYRRFEAGQTVVWAADRLEFVGSVVSGVATLSQTMEDGRTQMVGLLFPSDFIGRPGRDIAPFNVTAVADTTICCFRRRPFEQLLFNTPHIGQRLLEMALDELDAAREWMLLLGRKTAREKIASLIAIIARREAALSERRPSPGMQVTTAAHPRSDGRLSWPDARDGEPSDLGPEARGHCPSGRQAASSSPTMAVCWRNPATTPMAVTSTDGRSLGPHRPSRWCGRLNAP